jgi:hypothetical protein
MISQGSTASCSALQLRLAHCKQQQGGSKADSRNHERSKRARSAQSADNATNALPRPRQERHRLLAPESFDDDVVHKRQLLLLASQASIIRENEEGQPATNCAG